MPLKSVSVDGALHVKEVPVYSDRVRRVDVDNLIKLVLDGHKVCLTAIGHGAIVQATKLVMYANRRLHYNGVILGAVPYLGMRRVRRDRRTRTSRGQRPLSEIAITFFHLINVVSEEIDDEEIDQIIQYTSSEIEADAEPGGDSGQAEGKKSRANGGGRAM